MFEDAATSHDFDPQPSVIYSFDRDSNEIFGMLVRPGTMSIDPSTQKPRVVSSNDPINTWGTVADVRETACFILKAVKTSAEDLKSQVASYVGGILEDEDKSFNLYTYDSWGVCQSNATHANVCDFFPGIPATMHAGKSFTIKLSETYARTTGANAEERHGLTLKDYIEKYSDDVSTLVRLGK